MTKVLMVGSAEQSGGGVASVLRLMKQMPFWEKYRCGWLGTQIQRSYGVKLWYALKAYVKALFTIWGYDIVHFHTVPDKICLIIQLPVLRRSMAEYSKAFGERVFSPERISESVDALYKEILQ